MTAPCLEQVIHDRLAASADLAALLPADRILTGESEIDENSPLPSCMLTRQTNQALNHTSSGRIDQATIRIQLWHQNYGRGWEIVQTIIHLLDNSAWATPQVAVLCARRDNDQSLKEEDGVWQFVVDLAITYQESLQGSFS